jgi:diphthine-ammonia ligase
LLNEFIGLKFKAVIIAVKQGVLGASFLGKTLNPDVIREIAGTGADVSGESGEYHTVAPHNTCSK